MLVGAVVGASPAVGSSGDVGIIFRVNMANASLQPGENVVLRGSGATLGDWKGQEHVMQRDRADGAYTVDVRFPEDMLGQTIYYKFVVTNSGAADRWETRGNRSYTLSGKDVALPIVYFDEIEDSGLAHKVNVTFTVDLSDLAMDGAPPEEVKLMGGTRPLSWDPEQEGIPMERGDGNGTWTASVSFPKGTPRDVAFKLNYRHLGRWIWESTPGHINHAFLLDDEQREQPIRLRYDTDTRRLLPFHGAAGSLDDYAAIVRTLGDRGRKGDYLYFQAVSLLVQGERLDARETYRAFQQTHPGGIEIDDFDYLWAHDLAAQDDMDAALAFCDSQAVAQADPYRKAQFTYLKGELLLASDRRSEAREAYAQVLEDHADQGDAVDYALNGMALSYTLEDDSSEAAKGTEYLEQLAARGQTEARRGAALEELVNVHLDAGRLEAAEGAVARLEATSDESRSWPLRMRLWRARSADGEQEDVDKEIDALLDDGAQGSRRADLLLLKAESLARVGKKDESAGLYALVWHEGATSPRYQVAARRWLEIQVELLMDDYRSGRRDEAQARADSILEAGPADAMNAETRYRAAETSLHLGHSDVAVAALRDLAAEDESSHYSEKARALLKRLAHDR